MRYRDDKNSLGRKRLDQRLAKIDADNISTPPNGWVRAIRKALGMTTLQFARRLAISQPSAVSLEISEAHGGIRLSSLRRAAAALNCKLVYALVPNEPLESMVQARAADKVSQLFRNVERTMALEDQALDDEEVKSDQLAAAINDLDMRTLWDDEQL